MKRSERLRLKLWHLKRTIWHRFFNPGHQEIKGVYISVVEYGVQSYPIPEMAPDPNLVINGWRFMRIEYWCNDEPYAFLEHHVWMPPNVGSNELEIWMNRCMKNHNKRRK
jgi:hypothetical protein